MALNKSRSVEQIAGDIYTAKVALDALQASFGSGIDDFISKIDKATQGANDLRIKFQQSFGIFEEVADFNKKFEDLEIPTEKLAANFQLVGQSLETYVINKSDESILNFAKLTSVNEKLGISTSDTVKVINYLATGFGRSGEEIDKFSGKIVQFSRETGQEFKKVFSEFNQNIDKFYTILDPEKAGTQFMAFQQLARGFGSSIDRLMDTAAKFDSIESGVQFGTQLNNVLSAVGGSFDSMLASTMSYDDRIKYIIKQIGDSRENIMNMDEISRRAFVRQLEQTTQLGGKTIQAILMNEQLVDNMEKIAPEQREMARGAGGIQPANVEAIAQSFTRTQDRLQLFLNEYARIGSRLENIASEQAKFTRDVQRNTLGALADGVTQVRNLNDIKAKLREAVDSVGSFDEKKAEQIIKRIQTQTDKMSKVTETSLAAPSKGVLTNVPAPAAPSVTTAKLEEEKIDLRNSIQKGITDGIKTGIETAAPKEIKIVIEATEVLRNLLSAKGTIISPAAVVGGGKVTKP
jgi:hypothetical protein